MDVVEFLLFIPLLIFGIAMSELLGQFKRFFEPGAWYLPYLITLVVFTEVGIWNIYNFLDVFMQREEHGYFSYLADLSSPLLFLLATNALVRDVDEKHPIGRESFLTRMRLSYAFMGAFVALHLLPQFRHTEDDNLWIRLPAIALLFGAAVIRREWFTYAVGVIWAISVAQKALDAT